MNCTVTRRFTLRMPNKTLISRSYPMALAVRAQLLLISSPSTAPHRPHLLHFPLINRGRFTFTTTTTTTTTTTNSPNCISNKLPVSGMASASQSPPLTETITLPTGGDPIQVVAAPGVSHSDLRNAINSSLFKQWIKNMRSETGLLAHGKMCVRQVLIQGVDMFGRGVGFLKFKADVIEKETGTKIPGIVFARGPAVAVLILLESGGETYAVLTEQIRVPVGKSILELPAGMLDNERGDVVGTAVREVEEETGITLKAEDMVNLTAFLNPETGHKVFPSPGGCDEELSLFLYSSPVEEEIISGLHGKEMGLRDHGELIKVHIVPYDKLWRATADAKALAAIALYEMAKREGLLPRRNR